MLRLPNKLYPFTESILAVFPIILRAIPDTPISVISLYSVLEDRLKVSEYVDAMSLLLTLGVIKLDAKKGEIWRA